MQFGFMTACGTTNVIFILGQLQQKYLLKKKNLHFAFADLEKAFGRLPRSVVWQALRQLRVEEWLVQIVLCWNAHSRVRVNGTFSGDFLVRVGLHQGSVLGPSLFTIVLEALPRESRLECPEELLYVDRLALISETIDGLKERLKAWEGALELKGFRPATQASEKNLQFYNFLW